MNRRKFINNGIKACAATVFVEQIMRSQSLYAQSSFLNAISGSCSDNILVVVQLFGGNDGLNTFIPLDQYSTLQGVRSNVMINENNLRFATAVNNGMATLGSRKTTTSKYADLAFHPAMEGLYNLFEEGKMSVVMGCSYDNPDFSHFRATDIWMMGSDSNEFLSSGWIGRELESIYGGYGFPDPTELLKHGYEDPLCINMGSVSPLALNDLTGVAAGVSVTSITNDYPLLGGYGDLAPQTCAGDELTYLRKVSVDTDKYNARIVSAASKVPDSSFPKSLLYGNDRLSTDLRNVARLIKGGLQTRVYTVNQGGFDTHTSQVGSNTYDGTHTSLLNSVSRAISGFQQDIEKMGVADKVIGIVFTEFGRTVRSNGGKGTDHGRSTPIWLFGSSLKGGRYGTNPELLNPDTNKVETQVPMQFDYRSVYYSVLKDWFCLTDSQLESVFGGPAKVAKFAKQYHDLFRSGTVTSNTNASNTDRIDKLHDVYPNPIEQSGVISFNTTGGSIFIEIIDTKGNKVRSLMEKEINQGYHEMAFEKQDLKPGVYLVRMRKENYQTTKKLVIY
ncbi:hypothetical protein MYP_3088 [Sporocytophaga myxococcoides]|uniref:Secretion system C-terminal sorting domain-containing protein n=1 Tax=Sporocytophaga myxococcoides TaxID=153721 RepID=A0A098LHE1_9BACT|nr:DUF1501 domain-containing protein [Sporocytophaga myxococcoides]GAL85859.1 hypothetical protein MYP_3088 [Sporocytophaga myxococcoides]